MEAKLEESIANKEYYSAHQLLLSLAQRHQRAGRLEKSLETLFLGLSEFSQAPDAPAATIDDLGLKVAEVVEELAKAIPISTPTPSSGSGCKMQTQGLLEPIFLIMLKCGSEEGWKEYSSRLAKCLPRAVWNDVAVQFYPQISAYSDRLIWIISNCLQVPGVFKLFGREQETINNPLVVVETILFLLSIRSLGSASALLQSFIEEKKKSLPVLNIDDGSGSLPSFLGLLQLGKMDGEEEVRQSKGQECKVANQSSGNGDGSDNDEKDGLHLINFCQLLFILCQRSQPSAEGLSRLEQRYGPLIKKHHEIREKFDRVKDFYWPSKRPTNQMNGANPFAALLQNMMGGGGGGGSLFGFPPAPKASAGKPSSAMASKKGGDPVVGDLD